MKLKIELDLTPEEARTFLGLPDLVPLQEEVLGELRERLVSNLSYLDPQEVLRSWVSGTSRGVEEFRKFFGAAAARTQEASKDEEDEEDEDE